MSNSLSFLQAHLRRYRSRLSQVSFLGLDGWLSRASCGLTPAIRERTHAGVGQQRGMAQGDLSSQATTSLQHDQLVSDLRNRRRKRLFVTGGGGTGKSELLRLLAYELATDDSPLVPIIISLGRWRDGEDLLELAVGLGAEAMRATAQSGGVAFLLDGLDEVNGDRARIDTLIERLLDAYEDCTFVLSGRPGSLGSLHVYGFGIGNQYTLEPITTAEMQRYVLGYCEERGLRERGPDVWKLIAASGVAVQRQLRQPFMLSMACATYAEDTLPLALSSDTRALVERGLKQLLRWRKHDAVHNPSGPMQLDDVTCLDTLGALFANAIDADYRLDYELAVQIIGGVGRLSRAEAERRLSQLAPASGLLETTSGGQYRAVNRAIADYLAAKWIAQNGVPLEAAYSETLSANPIEHSIISFVGSRIWSDVNRELLAWLYWGLARLRPSLLVSIGRWLLKHLQGAELAGGMPGPVDDIRRTLLNRYIDLVAAIRPDAPIWNETGAQQLAEALSAFLPPNVDPFPGLDYGALRATHLPFRAACGEYFRDDFLGTSDALDAIAVANLLIEGWPEHDDIVKPTLIKKLWRQNDARKIANVAEFIATHWPEYRAEAGALVRREIDNWPGVEELKHLVPVLLAIRPEDRDFIAAKLLGMLSDEPTEYNFVCIVRLLLENHSADCRQRLERVLDDVLNRQHVLYGDTALLKEFAACWPREPGLRDAIAKMTLEVHDGQRKHGLAVALARVLHERESVSDVLLETFANLTIALENRQLEQTLAEGWTHRHDVRDEIRNQLRVRDLDFFGDSLASALAEGWPGDAKAASTILSRHMETALVWRESWFPWIVVICNDSAFDWLTDSEGCAWPLVNDGMMTAPFHGKIRSNYPQPDRAQCFFLVVRRDGIKRGLDRRLLPPVSNGDGSAESDSLQRPVASKLEALNLEARELAALRLLNERQLQDEDAPRQKEIARHIDVEEDVAGIVCRKLEQQLGLIHRPYGLRKGYRVTAAGLAVLAAQKAREPGSA